MDTLFDLNLYLSGPGSVHNVHSCIVGSALRDSLLLKDVPNNMQYDVHLGLGPDLYKMFNTHKWVQLAYDTYDRATDKHGTGLFHVAQNPLSRVDGEATVREGPLNANNIRVFVKKSTHKTSAAFMRNQLKGVKTSADEVALDLASHKISVSREWVKGYNTRTIQVNYGGIEDEFMDKYKEWHFGVPSLWTSRSTWPSISPTGSTSPLIASGHPLVTTPDPTTMMWLDEFSKIDPKDFWEKED